MVRALLAGTKTQTRRLVKPQPVENYSVIGAVRESRGWSWPRPDGQCVGLETMSELCPYGTPGDLLWVREGHAIVPRTAYARSDGVRQTLRPDDGEDAAIYRADWVRSAGGLRWRPSIHMPRWASRITLEITGVRVERLQEISIVDAIAEGVDETNENLRGLEPCMEWRYAYEDLWVSINDRASWNANPWVWVIEFQRQRAAA